MRTHSYILLPDLYEHRSRSLRMNWLIGTNAKEPASYLPKVQIDNFKHGAGTITISMTSHVQLEAIYLSFSLSVILRLIILENNRIDWLGQMPRNLLPTFLKLKLTTSNIVRAPSGLASPHIWNFEVHINRWEREFLSQLEWRSFQ